MLWGLLIQFAMGVFVLRISWGEAAFRFLSDQMVVFLDYTNNGTTFVYGFLATGIDDQPAVFAFSVGWHSRVDRGPDQTAGGGRFETRVELCEA